MSKFLDQTGLSNVLNKIKKYVTNNFVSLEYGGLVNNPIIANGADNAFVVATSKYSGDISTNFEVAITYNKILFDGFDHNTEITYDSITTYNLLVDNKCNVGDTTNLSSYNISTTYLELPYTQSYIKIGKPYKAKSIIMKAPASTITQQTVIDGVTYLLKYTGDNTITLGDNKIDFNPQLYLRKDSNTTKIDGISIITDTLYSCEDKTTYLTSSYNVTTKYVSTSYLSSTSIGTNSIYASEEDGTLLISSEGNGTVSINANDIELNADNKISTSNINTSYIYYKGFTDSDALAWCKNYISTNNNDYVIHSAHVIGFSTIGIVTVQLCVTGNVMETLYIYDSSANRMGFLPSTFISGFGLCNVGTFTFGVTSTGPNNYYLGNYDEA